MTRFCYAFIFLFQCSVLSADTLDQVWVTGTDTVGDAASEIGDVEHSEYTGSYSHINAAELARETSSLGQVIARESGVQFRQAGGAGSYSSVTIRASTGAQTDVYFDGVLLNNAGSGGIDLSQIELLNVNSVDVYRGSTPVQLGFGNLGGAVNIRGPRSAGSLTQILLGSGSFNSHRVQLSHQQKGSVWDTSVALTHQQSDNRFTYTNINGTPLNLADDRQLKQHNGQFDRDSLLFKFGRQQHERKRWDGLLQVAQRHQGVPHFRSLQDNQASYDTDSMQIQLNQRITAPPGRDWNNLTGIFINRNTEHYDDSLSQVGLGAQNTQSDTDVLGARTYWEHIGASGTFGLNAEFRSEQFSQDDQLDDEDFSAMRSSLNASLQYSLFQLEDALVVTPALRVRTLRDRYDGLLREGRERRSDTTALAQIGARYDRGGKWQWTLNFGQHSREPLFRELFGDRGFFIGNDSLVAEQGVNIDAGISWLGNADETRRLDLTLFASLRDELIVTTYDSRGIGRSENTGKAQIVGLESSLLWSLSDNWTGKINLTLQSAENLSNISSFNGKQLAGEAQVSAFASLQYQRARWSAWLDASHLSERFYDTANLLPADDQLIFNSGVAYQHKRFKSTLQLQNLSDENVEDFNGFPRPGRSVNFSLIYRFT